MNAQETALWILQSEDHFILWENRPFRPHVLQKESPYQPLIRVNGTYYHVKYDNGEPVVDYSSPVDCDE